MNTLTRTPANESRILIVDDDADIRSTVASILVDEGYDVVCAEDGLVALACLDQGPPPDLILLDLMMPVMDGWAFRAAQRRHRTSAAVPVVLMTARIDCRETATLALGAEECITKPFSLAALLAIVYRNVGRVGALTA